MSAEDPSGEVEQILDGLVDPTALDVYHATRVYDTRYVLAATGAVAVNAEGQPGEGVPAGGSTDQVLAKASDVDFDTEWVAPGGGSQPVTSPLDIPDCVLWLDASQLVGLSDGDPVSSWPDLSTSGFDFAQADNTKQPVYKTAIQNGLPVVRFDPSVTERYLDSVAAVGILNNKPGVTLAHIWGNMDYSLTFPVILFVSRNGDSVHARFAMADGYGTSNPSDAANDEFITFGATGPDRPEFADVDFSNAGAASSGFGWTQPGFCPRVIRCDWRAGNVVQVQLSNGGVSNYSPSWYAADAQANSVASNSDLVRLGAHGSPSGYAVTGDLGEVVVYDRALNSREARDLMDYLSAKWATI